MTQTFIYTVLTVIAISCQLLNTEMIILKIYIYIYIYTYIMFFLSIIFGTVSLWAKSMMIAGHMLQPRLIMSNFYNVPATAAHIKQDLSNATDPAFIICIFFVWRDEMY